jgi:hypothetical protein
MAEAVSWVLVVVLTLVGLGGAGAGGDRARPTTR